jgi:ribonuclease P protein component
MLRPAEFQRAYSTGRRVNTDILSANVIANSLPHPRLGLSVAARVLPTAVARNRFKRQVRESFRSAQRTLPAVDCVITARAAARGASGAVLRAALTQLWGRIAC